MAVTAKIWSPEPEPPKGERLRNTALTPTTSFVHKPFWTVQNTVYLYTCFICSDLFALADSESDDDSAQQKVRSSSSKSSLKSTKSPHKLPKKSGGSVRQPAINYSDQAILAQSSGLEWYQ